MAAKTGELVFVVDVDSFTRKGFLGTSEYEGDRISIEFDDSDAGFVLTSEMCKRISCKKGSAITVIVEREGGREAIESSISSVGDRLRASNSVLYRTIGGDGGGIFRISKA